MCGCNLNPDQRDAGRAARGVDRVARIEAVRAVDDEVVAEHEALGVVGAEVELTDSMSLSISLPVRVFTTAGFVTPRDKVARADGPGLNAAIAFRLGVTLLEAL